MYRYNKMILSFTETHFTGSLDYTASFPVSIFEMSFTVVTQWLVENNLANIFAKYQNAAGWGYIAETQIKIQLCQSSSAASPLLMSLSALPRN